MLRSEKKRTEKKQSRKDEKEAIENWSERHPDVEDFLDN